MSQLPRELGLGFYISTDDHQDERILTVPGMARLSSDEEAELCALFYSMASFEQYVSDALEIDNEGYDPEDNLVGPIPLVRRVLLAVARSHPEWARDLASTNEQIARLVKKQKRCEEGNQV